MKIAHINYTDIGGGAETVALSLCLSQPNAALLVHKKSTANDCVHVIPEHWSNYFFKAFDTFSRKTRIGLNIRAYLGLQNALHITMSSLRRMKEYNDAELIHIHNIHGNYFDLKAINSIAQSKAVVWTAHDMWPITGGEAGILPKISDREALKLYPLNGPYIDIREKEKNTKINIFNSQAIHIVAPSNDHLKKIRKFTRKTETSVYRIYNGIDLSQFTPKTKLYSKQSKASIFIHNTDNPFKNSKQVTSILSQITFECEVHVVGMPLRLENKNLSIIYLGEKLEKKELIKALQQAKFSIFSSNAETFGLLPCEAAACGSIVFLNKSLPVFIEHEKLYGALLYSDETSVIKKLESLVKDPETCATLQHNTQKMLDSNLSKSKMLKEYSELYKNVLKEWKK